MCACEEGTVRLQDSSCRLARLRSVSVCVPELGGVCVCVSGGDSICTLSGLVTVTGDGDSGVVCVCVGTTDACVCVSMPDKVSV